MNIELGKKDILCYFRMGLVTGLIEKQEVIAWADRVILQSEIPDSDIIDLSLAGKLPYSQMVRMLTEFQGPADYHLSVPMLFARAVQILDRQPERTMDLIMGLRLICVEERVPSELKSQLIRLDNCLTLHRQGDLPIEELCGQLSSFLEPYRQYIRLLNQIL